MNKKGFSLIGLLVAIVILAIVLTISVPKMLDLTKGSTNNPNSRGAVQNQIISSNKQTLKEEIKTQVMASNMYATNKFVKDNEGCYLFDFDEDTNGNVKSLSASNKTNFTGKISYCNNEFPSDKDSLDFNITD